MAGIAESMSIPAAIWRLAAPLRGRHRSVRFRLTMACAACAALVAVLSGVSLLRQRAVHGMLVGAADHERAILAALSLAAAVRDQYAHQAHMVIMNNREHLAQYEEAHWAAGTALSNAARHVATEEERRLVDEIGSDVGVLDRSFREEILPFVPGGAATRAESHDRSLAVVERIAQAARRLEINFADRAEQERRAADKAATAAAILGLLLLVVAVAIAGATGVYLDRSIGRPLRDLESATRKLALGDLKTVRVAVGGDSEFVALGDAFNDMARQLAERQESLVRTEKLAGMGRLAAGVAHEINNPLTWVETNLYFLRQQLRVGGGEADGSGRTGDIADALAEASDGVARIRQIVLDLRALAGRDDAPPEPFAVDEAVGKAARIASVRLKHVAKVVREIPPDLPAALASSNRMVQVLVNLFVNAADAIEEASIPGGCIWVRARAAADGLAVMVEDNGPGIPPAAMERLFEHFFTTKPEGRGTGLGLALSREYLRQLGGDLNASSRPEGGARFTLLLPSAPVPAAPAGEAAAA